MTIIDDRVISHKPKIHMCENKKTEIFLFKKEKQELDKVSRLAIIITVNLTAFLRLGERRQFFYG